ncbi:hypothetical protein QE152_g10169 [Popillia japonica]|uniref:Uncharacterized protein n=1 Tax=Popillia japonica TaxID=7064 RepID=A0AAW1LWC0_POPJA
MQRARAGSVGSADVYELFKRKRDENLVTDSEPFAPSKRLERSPVRNQAHGRGEDSGECKGSTIRKGNRGVARIKKGECANDKRDFGYERRDAGVEAHIRKGEGRMEKRKKEEGMGEKIEKLEDELWSLQKRERRNNLVIKGDGTEKIRTNVDCQRFIQAELGVQAHLYKRNWEYKHRYNRCIGWRKRKRNGSCNSGKKNGGNWEEKRLIMSNKQKLKGKRVYIDDDLTKKERKIQGRLIEVAKAERNRGKQERKIQGRLIEVAKAERNRGKQVRVGYHKISVEGKWMRWGVDIGTEENEKND